MIRANLSQAKSYYLASTPYYSLHGTAVNISCNVGDYIIGTSNYNETPTLSGMTLINKVEDSTHQSYISLYVATSATPTFTSGGAAGETNLVVMEPV